MPLSKKEQKVQARFLYFTSAASQKEIAFTVGVTEKTMSGWVRKGNWAAQKDLAFHSPDKETHHLYQELRQINKNIMSREDGERYSTVEELERKCKIISMITALKKNTDDRWRNVNKEAELFKNSTDKNLPKYFRVIIDTDGVQYDSDEDPEAASYQIKHGLIPGRFVD